MEWTASRSLLPLQPKLWFVIARIQPAYFRIGNTSFIYLSFHALYYLLLFFWFDDEFMRSCRFCFILQGKSEAWASATTQTGAMDSASAASENAGNMSKSQIRWKNLELNLFARIGHGSGATGESRVASRASLSEARTLGLLFDLLLLMIAHLLVNAIAICNHVPDGGCGI